MTATPQALITGVGVVSCAGIGIDALWEAVVHDRTQIEDGFGRISIETRGALERESGTGLSLPGLLAVSAAKQAMEQAAWGGLKEDDGLIIGTTAGQIPLWESELVAFSQGSLSRESFTAAIQHQSLASIAEVLARELQLKGPTLVVASACSASTQALALASMWLAKGKVKRCLVGGVEVLSQLTIEGFRSLQLLATEPATPFDRDRQGINLSEGSAFFCLEADGCRPLARLSGYGLSTDAYHMASPHPEGRGSYEAMRQAVARAGITAAEIDWVHAHGTGSKANDQAEGGAIYKLLGGANPWVSSTKWAHGHPLGASGAIESALCTQALSLGIIPHTGGLRNPDPGIKIRHPLSPVRGRIRHVLKNTLGFGGNNAALVLSAPEARA